VVCLRKRYTAKSLFEYGGVVPELARDHVRKLLPMVEEVLAK
jgi:tRNA A37 threonylcarbamoyltransferase TsaD